MNRRSFFARLFGGLAALALPAAARPTLPTARVRDYKRMSPRPPFRYVETGTLVGPPKPTLSAFGRIAPAWFAEIARPGFTFSWMRYGLRRDGVMAWEAHYVETWAKMGTPPPLVCPA